MAGSTLEYLGFTAGDGTRKYMLRIRQVGGVLHDITRAIANDAFLDHRVRYQDGPEVCFLILQEEMRACPGELPVPYLQVTDAELAQYRAARAVKPPGSRAKPLAG
jgi:hypothetical protein